MRHETIKVRSPVAVPVPREKGERPRFIMIEEVHLPPAAAARCAGRTAQLREAFRTWFRRRISGVQR